MFVNLLFDHEMWDAALPASLSSKLGVDTSKFAAARVDLHSIEGNATAASAAAGPPRALSFVMETLQGSSLALGEGASISTSVHDDATGLVGAVSGVADGSGHVSVVAAAVTDSPPVPQVRRGAAAGCVRIPQCFRWSEVGVQDLELDEFNASPVMMAVLRVVDDMFVARAKSALNNGAAWSWAQVQKICGRVGLATLRK
jgi:hypothetical protein